MDEENRERTDAQKKKDEENREGIDAQNKNGESVTSATSGTDTSTQSEHILENASGSERFNPTGTHDENKKCCPEVKGFSDGMSASQTGEDAKCPEHIENPGNVSNIQGCLINAAYSSLHSYKHFLFNTKQVRFFFLIS